MKILYDTNIILDIFLFRTPFVYNSIKLVSAVENSIVHGYLCATTITTIQYLISKELGKSKSNKEIKKLFAIFDIAIVNKIVLERAIVSGITDIEDAVINESAISSGVEGIVTRNIKDYKKSKLSIYEPHELVAALDL
ncbi:MAG: PIN domain-containing protein [Candidatus Dadabacteria bacterium]|nr:PIN domain-containing protein [Candidatus Dadabacteria bacterium]